MSFRISAVSAMTALASLALLHGPARAAAAPPPLEAYGKLPDVDHVSLSPSGKRFAWIGSTPEGRVIFASEQNKPLARAILTDGSVDNAKEMRDAKISRVTFADEDHVLVEVHRTADPRYFDRNKYEFSQIVILNLKTQKLSWVFASQPYLIHYVLGDYGYISKDGHSYGFFAGQLAANSAESYLFRVDLDSGQVEHVGGNDYDWLVGPDGTVLAHVEYENRFQEWRLYAEASHAILAKGKDRYGGAVLEGLGRSAGTIVYNASDEDGAGHYYETALTPGGPQTPVFDDILVAGLRFDPVSRRLAGALTEDDSPAVVFTDPTRQSIWKGVATAFPEGYRVSLVSADDAFEHLIVYTDAEGDAGTYWLIDLKTMKADRFADAYPSVPAAAVGPQKVIAYKAADGVELHGILTLPAGREPKGLPVIVFPHGGPEARDYLGFNWWAQAMASRGYAVFQPNFRGSSGYGFRFAKAGFGEWGRKMQTDISDGLKALAEQGIVDSKRACIVGGSYGGYAALAGVTVQHQLYRCAVSVAGISDLREFLSDKSHNPAHENPEIRYWKDAMGAKSLSDGALREISPANLADKADAPILLIHGKDDSVVPIEQSRIMERALKAAGKPVEFVTLDGEDHHLSREPTRVAMLKALVAFVEAHNPPN